MERMHNERLNEFVEEVSARTDLLQVVQSYVPLKRKGNRYWGCCPFHQENTPSFSVVPDKGFFYCFGCHAGGNAFKFLSLIENVSYFEAIKLQAEKLGIEMPRREQTPAEIAREQEIADLRKVNEMARDFFYNCLTMTRLGVPGKEYFSARGISDKTIETFRLGFSPDAWDKLSNAFQKRGVKKEFLIAAGLAAERKSGEGVYDRFRGRIMIPIVDERGRVVGFGGRVLDDSTPKYLNTPETILFNKRRLLFGLKRAARAIKKEGYAIVVEGYMDAISLFSAGVENVVATLGTAFTAEHCKKLLRYAQEICFCYDSDEAGQSATIRALGIVRDTGARVKVVVVPDGKDPDEYIRKHGADAFRALAQQALPLVEYRMQYVLTHTKYDTLDGKVQALHQMMPVLSGLREPAIRSEYEKKLARVLMLDEGIVRDELRRYSRDTHREDSVLRHPIREAVQKTDNAMQRAGRIVLRMAWQDPTVLEHTQTIVPLSVISDAAQQEIFHFLQNHKEKQLTVGAMEGAVSDEAAAELSRALVEDIGEQSEAEAYTSALNVLRKSHLQTRYMEHSRRAEAYLQAGDPAYREELSEVNRIKHEMDMLQV